MSHARNNITITFANSTQQYLYFRGKVSDGNGRIFPQNSYQRTSSNKIRLELGMAEAIQYNYLYFKNISFENKYFYAFITNWEYVNNITTEITYEIDVMQSFITNAIVKQCFVEREHIQNDTIGANLVPEGLEQGDYIVDGYSALLKKEKVLAIKNIGKRIYDDCIKEELDFVLEFGKDFGKYSFMLSKQYIERL